MTTPLAPREKAAYDLEVHEAKDVELKEALSLKGTKPALGEDGVVLTYIRESDGYLNATELCKKTALPIRDPMLFKDWQKLGATRKSIAKAQTLGMSEDMLIEKVKDVCSKKAVWIHPCLVPEFVIWCGLKFNMETVTMIQSFADSKPMSPESQFLQSLRGDDDKMVTEIRMGDGFINATKMCQSSITKGNKQKVFKDWEKANKPFLRGLALDLDRESGFDDKITTTSRCDGLSSRVGSDPLETPVCYNHLVDVIHGGKYSGSWVHPRVAIELARWCSVKFCVQTNGLISRYAKGEVTTEESKAVAAAIQKDVDDQLVSHPLPITYPDVSRRDVVDKTLGIPTHALPPNVAYVIRLGDLSDGHTVDKYGRTTNFAVRMGNHEREHPGCQILMIVTTGTHDSKPIEDTLRAYFGAQKVDVEKPSGRALTECFKSMSDVEYIDTARLLIQRTHSDIIETIHFNDQFYDFRPKYDQDALLIEREKTLQATELTKQEEAKSVQAQELTKQLTIRLELAKLGAAAA